MRHRVKKLACFGTVLSSLLYLLTWSPLTVNLLADRLSDISRYLVVGDGQSTPAPTEPLPPHMDTPMAILFTSFSNRTDKLFVYTNTIRNWAAFLPHIQPVLFTTFQSGPVIDVAKKYGWYVHPNPQTNVFGSPVLKEMYLSAYATFNATFYGFANGDILFDWGLNSTLSKVQEHTGVLIVTLLFGTRKNYNMLPEANYSTDPLWPPLKVAERAQKNYSKLFRYDAFDYFFVTKHYPFANIKPLVIGRSGFDTYLVAMTNNLKLTSIDGTDTIQALHQTDHDGNFAHNAPKNQSNTKYNRNLIGKFNYTPGFAHNAKYGSSTHNETMFLKCRHCKDKTNLL